MQEEQKDSLTRFIFKNMPARGEIVRLDESCQEILKRHPYTLEVQKLLGEALVSASILAAMLNEEGSLIIQMQGDGPVSLLLAQASAKLEIRGLANWTGEISSEFSKAVGRGHLAITIDSGVSAERYQGIVELKAECFAKVIENYFYQSEQVPTFLFLAANENSATGFLLQLMPNADEEGKKYWEHLNYLSRTLTAEELLRTDNHTILRRLFHQEDITLFDSQKVKFICRCSRDAMAKAIYTMGKADAVELAEKNKMVSVTCEFCNKQIDFDRIDIERIFL